MIAPNIIHLQRGTTDTDDRIDVNIHTENVMCGPNPLLTVNASPGQPTDVNVNMTVSFSLEMMVYCVINSSQLNTI